MQVVDASSDRSTHRRRLRTDNKQRDHERLMNMRNATQNLTSFSSLMMRSLQTTCYSDNTRTLKAYTRIMKMKLLRAKCTHHSVEDAELTSCTEACEGRRDVSLTCERADHDATGTKTSRRELHYAHKHIHVRSIHITNLCITLKKPTSRVIVARRENVEPVPPAPDLLICVCANVITCNATHARAHLREQRVGWMRDDGGGHAGDDARTERHSDVVLLGEVGRRLACRLVPVVGAEALHGELGHRVGDLLEQNRSEAGVEAEHAVGREHLHRTGTESFRPCGVGH
jgi:hypothetical protein